MKMKLIWRRKSLKALVNPIGSNSFKPWKQRPCNYYRDYNYNGIIGNFSIPLIAVKIWRISSVSWTSQNSWKISRKNKILSLVILSFLYSFYLNDVETITTVWFLFVHFPFWILLSPWFILFLEGWENESPRSDKSSQFSLNLLL